MTIQERIDEISGEVREALEKHGVSTEEVDEIINKVEYLGYEWREANAHLRVSCIAAGMMQHPEDEKFNLNDKAQMKKLEYEGSSEIIGQFGLPTYAGLVTECTNGDM